MANREDIDILYESSTASPREPWIIVGEIIDYVKENLKNCKVFAEPHVDKSTVRVQFLVFSKTGDNKEYYAVAMSTADVSHKASRQMVETEAKLIVSGIPKMLGTKMFSKDTQPISVEALKILVDPVYGRYNE